VAVAEPQFAQFHAGRWGVGEGAWLPPGAWAACAGDAEIEPGEEIVAAVDIGGRRSASVVVFVTDDLRVQAKIWQGDAAVVEVVDYLEQLAGTYKVREIAFDPWGFKSEAVRLEERGLPMVQYDQTNARMGPASEGLYAAIVEGKLTHPNDPEFNRHVANARFLSAGRRWVDLEIPPP
jgi:Phage Terminase